MRTKGHPRLPKKRHRMRGLNRACALQMVIKSTVHPIDSVMEPPSRVNSRKMVCGSGGYLQSVFSRAAMSQSMCACRMAPVGGTLRQFRKSTLKPQTRFLRIARRSPRFLPTIQAARRNLRSQQLQTMTIYSGFVNTCWPEYCGLIRSVAKFKVAAPWTEQRKAIALAQHDTAPLVRATSLSRKLHLTSAL
jgi:hypothetical protein